MEKYRLYSVQEFMSDVAFQDWVFQPNEQRNEIWNVLTEKHPELLPKITEAKRLLQLVVFKEEFPAEERVEQVLKNVQSKMHAPAEAAKVVGMRTLWKYAAAAAVVLLLAGSLYLVLQKPNRAATNSETIATVPHVIVPGGTKATLTLADGTVVQLDSAGVGNIASQGNSTVYTNNGELAYTAANENANKAVVFNTVNTPKGGLFQITLVDGTKVWLNSASSLRYPTSFTGETRVVELTGEGYFEVAHNAKQPFHVKVNDMEVAVLGTHFNINSYDDEPSVKTTLLEGKVMVKKAEGFVYLNPGQQAVVIPEQPIRIAPGVDVEEVVAWKNGKFLFNGADVEAIMRQVARWYDVDIKYEAKINDPISGGLARSENVQQLLSILEATGKVKFRVNGKQITVRAN